MVDQKKTYTVTTATTPARPRSKARRDGTGLTSGGASAIIENSTAGNAQRASHANTADEASHALRADEAARAATAKTAEHATTADRATAATRADEATHAATATNATTAERANTADTATRAQSAQTADHAATAARAEQAQRATEAETLRTPNYSDGLTTGAGARIDATGNAEFQSMAVRGFFRAAEYQINRIALSEGDVFHTENGLVKSAEQQADGRWKVVLQERFQGDVTGFRAGDVLRGAYNSVGTAGGAAEIRTSWLRVEAVDAQAGTLTASLYADNQTPEGRNAPPVPLMRLARWGNTTDPERQSHIMESATDGRIVRRVKVSAPIVDGAQSDGFVVGKLPAWLREHFGAAVADASDYVFARGIITQNILRYTPAGRPLAERVDRGLWSASARYFYEEQNPETGAFEISRVWHDGALYELARGGNGNTAPAAQSTHWTLIQAKPKDGDKGDAGESYRPNLLENSAFTKGFDYWAPEGRLGVIDDTEISPVQGTRVVRIDTAMLGALSFASFYQSVAGRLRPNTTYTLSVWVKTSQELKRATILFAFKPLKFLDISYQHGGEWTRCAITFTTFPEKNTNQSIRLRLNKQEGAASVWFAAPKLEIGDTPTEWTPSENDRKGEKGDNGRGVSRMRAFYMLTTERDAPQPDTSGWMETAPQPTKERPWLWSYERSEYSDGTADQTVVRLIGHYGKDGTNGTSIRAQYSADARTWHDDFAEGDVWMRTGNGTTWGGALRVVGESGADGKSPVYDFAASSQLATASSTTAPTIRGTWQDAPPTLRDGEVLWYRLTAANGKITYGRLSGEKGDKGDAGESYRPNLLENSAFTKGFDYWAPEGRLGVIDDTEISPVQGTRVVRIDTAMLGALSFASFYQSVAGRLRPNTTYTLSVWVKTSQELKRATILFAFKPLKFLDISYQHGGEWTRCAITFTTFPEKNTNQSIRLRLNKQEGAASVWFAAPKLEVGDTPTEWTPSENDRKGDKGDPGRGIERIETFYLLTADGTAPEDGAGGWRSTPRVPTPQTPWLWTYERVVYSDGTSVRTPVRLDTRLAKNGADAEPMRPNLLDGTDFRQLGRTESAWKIGTHGEEPVAGRANISLFSSAVDGCVPALCAINPGTKEGEFAQLFQNVGQLIPGRTYTFSAYVRGADVAWLIVYPTPAEHFHPNTVKQDDWTRVTLTFRAPAVQDPDGVLLLLRAWHRETTPHTGYAKSVVWCAPKLEEGGGPTQWCPSFRDQRGADGSPGVRGAAVRLLGDYAQLADGTPFESGHVGETFLDVVQVRQGEQVQFYQCKQPHAKSADKAPAADSEWWELGTYQGFVATDLLLARRSLIKNLQVENVVGRDERGNATFELDAATGTAYIGGTATFAGFIRRRPVVITPENWKEYGGEMGRNGDVFYLNPFAVGTYVIFRGDFGALRPTIDTSNDPLGEGRAELTEDNSHLMRYYGAQFMVFNDTPTSLFIGGVKIDKKGTAVFTMLGRKRDNPTLWWKGELVGSW